MLPRLLMPSDPSRPRPPDPGRAEFRQRGLHAKRSFGQCFLADPNIARNIAIEATTPPGGTCLEIGPGTGALTRHLLARASKLVAIERDRDLVPVLRDAFSQQVAQGALMIVEADALAADWLELLGDGPSPRTIVGNVPYNITGRLLERAIRLASSVDRVVFMVQKEVADRIAAPIASKDYGALSVFAQHAFTVAKRMFVPSSCFRPRPDVDSTVIVLEPARRQEGGPLFYELVTTSFSKRRKTLRNAWRGWRGISPAMWEEVAARAGVSLEDRPERLAPDAWVRVAQLAEELVSSRPAGSAE